MRKLWYVSLTLRLRLLTHMLKLFDTIKIDLKLCQESGTNFALMKP